MLNSDINTKLLCTNSNIYQLFEPSIRKQIESDKCKKDNSRLHAYIAPYSGPRNIQRFLHPTFQGFACFCIKIIELLLVRQRYLTKPVPSRCSSSHLKINQSQLLVKPTDWNKVLARLLTFSLFFCPDYFSSTQKISIYCFVFEFLTISLSSVCVSLRIELRKTGKKSVKYSF